MADGDVLSLQTAGADEPGEGKEGKEWYGEKLVRMLHIMEKVNSQESVAQAVHWACKYKWFSTL